MSGAPNGDARPAASNAAVADYEMLRRRLGAFRLEHDVVVVRGPDALGFLQSQCSQDVAALARGACADALLLSPQGKVEALIRVTRVDDEEFVVDVEGGWGDAVVARLERFKLRVKVEIGRLPWRGLALRGPLTPAAGIPEGLILGTRPGALGGASLVLPFSWETVAGVDVLGDDPQPPAGARWCAPESWEAVRIEAGIPRLGAEIDDHTIPAEVGGLLERCVDFDKGCYTGQELVARLEARGNRVARRLCGLVFDAAADWAPATVCGAEVVAGDKTVGSVTSAAWSPGLERLVGLAFLHRSVEPGTVLGVRGGDARSGSAGSPARAESRVLPMVP